ncbi:Phloem protein 2-like protein [Artemisia annua]|uniref:Phloem protein 2-like protein n=1 Tax=Artemisia annua TaxID=35608 RepID=A0A2U1PZ33_ARTAN|nr:Phloem protein 2-like protein [Artemisia annua]
MAELYQFTSDRTTIDLEILFGNSEAFMIVEGIEFKPLEKEEREGIEDEKVEDMKPISDLDEYWEQKLPDDYEDIIKRSEYDVHWTTKKELYSILCTGLLINDSVEWLFLDNNGNKCLMISARAAIVPAEYEWPTLPESRFGEVAVIDVSRNVVFGKIKYGMLSPETTYANYIVYKLPQDQSKLEAPLIVSSEGSGDYWYIYLVSPQTPVIVRGKVDENTRKPSNKPKIKGIPRQRSDGWMEVQVLEFQTDASMGVIPGLELKTSSDVSLDGIMIQGMELRPM